MVINFEDSNPRGGIQYFKFARREALKSTFRCRVGACLVVGKSIVLGFNKNKTHPVFANPSKHIKTSIHAELDCLSKIGTQAHGTLYVYRETKAGMPAMAKPCEHCMSFLKKTGIDRVYYSTPVYPYWSVEVL